MEIATENDGTHVELNSMFGVPAINTPLDTIFGEYAYIRKSIMTLANEVSGNVAMGYFCEGLRKGSRDHWGIPSPASLFNCENAIAALNAEYWNKVMTLTGVLKVMPAAKRTAWYEEIREMKTPDFVEENVRATVMDLFNSRSQFFAEKVDGIFKALSSEHVTNVPEGFGRRLIMASITGYGSYSRDRIEYLHDLRGIIAGFLGREEFVNYATREAVGSMKTDGKWNVLDGGAVRMRLYKKGTCHIEIHPDIAWQLNKVLAFLYPLAIPAQFRTKPAKRHKEFALRSDVLSQSVLNELYGILELLRGKDRKRLDLSYKKLTWQREIEDVLTAIGGVQEEGNAKVWLFDYEPIGVVREIIRSAMVPEQKCHQFYPTPAGMAQDVVDLAEIEDHHTCLEPQSGGMAIGRLLPVERTQCVEISALHCSIAKTLGYQVEQADFLAWEPGRKFDRICSNPPFSEGRALAHTVKAASLLAQGGRLTIVLPGSMRGKDVVRGMKHSWGELRHNEFKDASVSVTILKLDNL